MQDEIRPEPYCGEIILEDSDFLRRLPILLDPRQRLIFEALVHISDCIAASFFTMHQTATLAARMEGALPTLHRAQISNAAWSIIDDFYAIKKLIELINQETIGPETAKLLGYLEPSAKIRNGMDHLDTSIGRNSPGNLLKSKGSRRAVFGSVSFFHIDSSDLDNNDIKLRWISISAGPLGGKNKFPFTFPVGEKLAAPIDRFQLSAFNYDVDISNCIALYRDWLRITSKMAEAEIRLMLEEKHPNDVDRLINEIAPSNVIHVVKFDYKGPGATSDMEKAEPPGPAPSKSS
ncbi:hypothetical protein [Caulobacter sp.]|uniref:hypothetical protein n=1 Tax=Caulobacter sp. TaxID=78 RepID=UPI002B48955E|nr:hypothetical protein [Caulobacter sp.]HJV40272.1 hypothetical protein [Caulobacter sp.]